MTNKILAPRLLACGVALALAGCSAIDVDSKKIDYKSASKAPTLEVPPDLVAPARSDRYAIPEAGGRASATYSNYANERSPQVRENREVLPTIEKVRIERYGNERWLVVPGTPDKVWDTLRDFWQETGFIIYSESPAAGVMETDWAENRAKLPQDFLRKTLGKVIDSLYSTAERDKFRTRIERGSQPETVEIYVSHRGMLEKYITEGKEQTKWEPRDPDPDLEAEMLRRMMLRFGSDESQANAQLANSKQRAPDRATIERGADSTPQLLVSERFDRAWRRVGLVLDRVGFTVEDRDRAKGMYFVRYVDPEAGFDNKKDPGILSRLAFWRSDKQAAAQSQYRVLLQDAGEATRVQVMTREGGVDRSETAGKILTLLHEQLR